MRFLLEATDRDSHARAGVLHTSRGIIHTPIFMPVGTLGNVKGVEPRLLQADIGAQIILGNTYHLYLRPGLEVLQRAQGLHHFMQWKGPILTDSGGYQVHSLCSARKITEEGVRFRSHIDGSYHQFTPENVVDMQRIIGSDIMMPLDECTPYPASYSYVKHSVERTHRWLKRSLERFAQTSPEEDRQVLFPIVQGSVYEDLRYASAHFAASLDCPGNAIGGVTRPSEVLYATVERVCGILPANKPRYLMGVGTPEDLLECIAQGIDMFDCVMPTRHARNGMLFTTQGTINLRNRCWQYDMSALDSQLGGYVSTHFSKAYMRHLLIAGEVLAIQLASIHNLTFYLWLVRSAREHILKNNFVAWKKQILPTLKRRLG